MNILKKIRKINWRRGNGTLYLSSFVLFLAFAASVAVMEIFNLYYNQSKLQTITDTVADGSAIAALTPVGFDRDRMDDAANELLQKNGVVGTSVSTTIVANDEKDSHGNRTGDKLVTVNLLMNKNYLVANPRSYGSLFSISSHSKVRAKVVDNSAEMQTHSFAGINNAVATYPTTSDGSRNAAYINWLIEYRLNPEYNPVYQRGGINNSYYFIYDYLISMRFNGFNSPLLNWEQQCAIWLNNTLSSWTDITGCSATQIQNIADTGKPVVVTLYDSSGKFEAAVVVPRKGVLSGGEIALARVGEKNDNYVRTNYNDLKSEYTVKIFTHN